MLLIYNGFILLYFNVSADRILGICMRIASPYSVHLFFNIFGQPFVWRVSTRDHTVLPATHTFIYKWNEPYLPLLPNRTASPHFAGTHLPFR